MRYIPKVIHMIWFGGKPFNIAIQKCVDSWKKWCPDYEIKIWNEETFDINTNAFVKEAYEAKKWAFVSDYVRLYALYNEGGVYLDSDVEVVKNFDCLLEDEHVVTGYSSKQWIPAGFMASEKGNCWIRALLDYYTDRHFVLEDGKMDMKVNNEIISTISKEKFGFRSGDLSIEYGNVRLYPRVYFHPYKKQVIEFTEDTLNNIKRYFNIDEDKTYCIHYSMGSWVTDFNTTSYKIKHFIRKHLPQSAIEFLEGIYYRCHNWKE